MSPWLNNLCSLCARNAGKRSTDHSDVNGYVKLGIEASVEIFPGEEHVPRSMTTERFLDLMESLRHPDGG